MLISDPRRGCYIVFKYSGNVRLQNYLLIHNDKIHKYVCNI